MSCEIKKNVMEDALWLKCLCNGQGLYCPDIKTAALMPIHYGQNCCLEESCGLNPAGKFVEIIGMPHPLNDLWCMSKFCCFKSYCGVPYVGHAETQKWFQLCCIQMDKTEFKFISPSKETLEKGFCWFRCCCEGSGMECPGLFSGNVDSLIKPIIASVECCFASECGVYQKGEIAGCIPHPLNQTWCSEKCCCLQTYCGIGMMLAEPFQLCCLLFNLGKGSKFEPMKGDSAPISVDNII